MIISQAIIANGRTALCMCFLNDERNDWELDVVMVPYRVPDADGWHPVARFRTAIEAFDAAKAWLSAGLAAPADAQRREG